MTFALNSVRSTRFVFSALLLLLSFGAVSSQSIANPIPNVKDECKRDIVNFDKELKTNPQNSEALTERARCLATLGDHPAAIVDYTDALKLDQTVQYELRGESYMAVKNYKNALADFDAQINQRNASAAKITDASLRKFSLPSDRDYANRGKAHQALGNAKAAIVDFDQALKLNPGAGDAYYGRALAKRSLGQKKEALQDFKRAAESYEGTEEYEQIMNYIKEFQQ